MTEENYLRASSPLETTKLICKHICRLMRHHFSTDGYAQREKLGHFCCRCFGLIQPAMGEHYQFPSPRYTPLFPHNGLYIPTENSPKNYSEIVFSNATGAERRVDMNALPLITRGAPVPVIFSFECPSARYREASVTSERFLEESAIAF